MDPPPISIHAAPNSCSSSTNEEMADAYAEETTPASSKSHRFIQVIKLLNNRKPKSLEVCCLLNKFSRRETDVESKWVGFDIPDEFVVGYGIDYAQDNRHLPFIGKVVQE